MEIPPEMMSECVKYFKEHKFIARTYIQRKHKISSQLSQEICQKIEKRFPNLWKNGRDNFIAK